MPPTCGMVMVIDIAWASADSDANALDGLLACGCVNALDGGSVVGLALVCIM